MTSLTFVVPHRDQPSTAIVVLAPHIHTPSKAGSSACAMRARRTPDWASPAPAIGAASGRARNGGVDIGGRMIDRFPGPPVLARDGGRRGGKGEAGQRGL